MIRELENPVAMQTYGNWPVLIKCSIGSLHTSSYTFPPKAVTTNDLELNIKDQVRRGSDSRPTFFKINNQQVSKLQMYFVRLFLKFLNT